MRMRFALGVLAAVASAYSVGCTPVRHNLPPAERLMEPGPGVGGPGPGVVGSGNRSGWRRRHGYGRSLSRANGST